MKKSEIALQKLELEVFLGWPDKERLQSQSVILDVTIQFATPPSACQTDHLDDTYCYDHLIQNIKKTATSRSFRLIENLGYELFQTIKQFLDGKALITVNLTKAPPIPNLMGGVTFSLSDV